MEHKKKILDFVNNEIDNIYSNYNTQIRKLENENRKLRETIKKLEMDNGALHSKMIDNSVHKNDSENKSEYENLLKYWVKLFSSSQEEILIEMCTSSDANDCIVLLNICHNLIDQKDYKNAINIINLLKEYYQTIQFDGTRVQDIFFNILTSTLLKQADEINEDFDELVINSLNLLMKLHDIQFGKECINFIQKNFDDLLGNIFNLNSPLIITTFMRVCLKFNLKFEIKDIFMQPLDSEWEFLDSSITREDFIFLLWYSYLFYYDDQFLDKVTECKKWFQNSDDELALYFYLNENKVQHAIKFQAAMKKFLDGNVLTTFEKQEIVKKVEKEIGPVINIEEETYQVVNDRIIVIKNALVEKYIKTHNLVLKNVTIPLYKSNNDNLIRGYINGTVYTNDTFKKNCISEYTYEQLLKKCNPLIFKTEGRKELDIKSEIEELETKNNHEAFKNRNSVPKHKIVKNTFKWPETENRKTDQTSSTEEINLNENSALKLMGYQITGVSRNTRWQILEKAVPRLGLKKVASIIAYNIKLRKGQKNGQKKYYNAISEWEHDLLKLRRVYYKKDFNWPNT